VTKKRKLYRSRQAASWGGKDNGFGLSKCCSDDPMSTFPESATTLHFEFYTENKTEGPSAGSKAALSKGQTVTVINVEQVDHKCGCLRICGLQLFFP
jgi:E3 ubiquitin-protein ligase HUWE1